MLVSTSETKPSLRNFMNNIKNWLSYYKNSLYDSENLAVDIARIKNLFTQNYCDLSTALIDKKNAETMLDAEERRINRLRGITKKDNPKWKVITETEILISPFQLEFLSDSKYKPEIIHPFWIGAKVSRSGQLTPSKELFPLIVRNYLTPIADIGNEFVFSSMDKIMETREIEQPMMDADAEVLPWNLYWDYLLDVFANIAHSNFDGYRVEGYRTNHKVIYFATSSKIATAKSILFLYENIINETEDLPLVEKLVNPANRERKEPITDAGFLNYNHLHLGQMSDQFPLSISQRKTLLSYLTSENNAITAVNGPPGTGKTTLLQSLVATEFVRSAIKGEDAPVILACSTNNQAVTNIIDSFINSESSIDILSDRWIPDFYGYATYLPSNSKSEKSLKNINYLKGNLFGYEGTLCELDDEKYLFEAEEFYFEKFSTYFGHEAESLEDVCDFLQEEISVIEDKLMNSVRISADYIKSIESVNGLLLDEVHHIKKNKIQIAKLLDWRTILNKLKALSKEQNFIDEIKKYFKSENASENNEANEWLFKIDASALENNKTALTAVKNALAAINLALSSNLKLNDWKLQNEVSGYPFVSEEQMWEFEYEKMNSDDKSHRFFYDEIDITLRHKAFLLATHYWEARWIIATHEALEEETEKGTGEKAIALKWKRRAMLTPCFVATFYMAPTHFLYSQFQGENEEGKPVFEYLPLYNFLDLLIIDEAGQVTPEVSIPVFSLAKKAMVVGDLKQIEPIWSIPEKIDFGNLLNQNIAVNSKQTDYLHAAGFLASSGSVMKMAQNACEYETPLITGKENGLLLLEHRRCNDEIIGFCNELAYGGILKPMKGKAHKDQIFPSMVAYHIDGFSERKYNSRCNLTEVKAIISWLVRNKESIESAYNIESVESVLGIITPFTSQKSELSKALTDAGFNINKIKLGTVHALQGAERNIVLFSSVYTSSDEGTLFFDRDNKPNMLNVAVSRARDSFILFGDTNVFNEENETPSGVLKKHLVLHELEQ